MKKACILGLTCLLIAGSLAAEEEEPLWSGDFGLSYLATTGNTDTMTGGATFNLKRRPSPWGLEAQATVQRATEQSSLTAERYFVTARALRSLNERWDLFAGVSGEQDRFTGVDSRFVLLSGAKWKALTGPRHLLDLDLGLTWTDEELVDTSVVDDYWGAVLGFDYKWKISETSSFTQSIVYFPNFDVSEDWRLESETAIQAQIMSRLALKASYEIRYRNEPIDELEDTDTTTRVSVVLTF